MPERLAALPAIAEVRRLASPAPFPQALAAPRGAACLYMAPREVPLLYTIDVSTLVVTREIPLPGSIWGATIEDRVLTFVASSGPDDDRVIRSYDLDGDLQTAVVPCPDATGSYVAVADGALYLTQFYRRRLLRLDEDGTVLETTAIPHDICGVAHTGDALYLITTDDEESEAYFLTQVVLGRAGDVTSVADVADVARIPFKARSLAWDGDTFWTNHRDRHEIVAFRRP